jgi:hypothetical protein
MKQSETKLLSTHFLWRSFKKWGIRNCKSQIGFSEEATYQFPVSVNRYNVRISGNGHLEQVNEITRNSVVFYVPPLNKKYSDVSFLQKALWLV